MATLLETLVRTVSRSSSAELPSSSKHSDWMNQDPEALEKSNSELLTISQGRPKMVTL